LIDEASSDLGVAFLYSHSRANGSAYYVGASQMQGLVPGLFHLLGTDPQKIEPVKHRPLLDEIHKLAK